MALGINIILEKPLYYLILYTNLRMNPVSPDETSIIPRGVALSYFGGVDAIK